METHQDSNVIKSLNASELIRAIESGKLSEVKKLVNRDQTLLSSILNEENEFYAIHIAVQNGVYKILKYLLDKNSVMINYTDKWNQTAIMYAAYFASIPTNEDNIHTFVTSIIQNWFDEDQKGRFLDIFKELILRNPDLSKKINRPEGPFHNYSIDDLPLSEEIIIKLLPSTSKPNQLVLESNKSGSSEIAVVCSNKEQPTFRGLTAESSDFARTMDPVVEPPEFRKSHKSFVEFYEYTFYFPPVANADGTKDSFIQACNAMHENKLDHFESFLKEYPSLVHQIRPNSTLLLLAMEKTSKPNEYVLSLMKSGANPNLGIQSTQGLITPIQLLLKHLMNRHLLALNYFNTVAHIVAKIFIDYDADLNAKIENGYSLIHCVIWHFPFYRENDCLELVKTILEKDPEQVNKANDEGITPLMMAAAQGFETVVKYLLENKADETIRVNNPKSNYHGYAAIHFAAMDTEYLHTGFQLDKKRPRHILKQFNIKLFMDSNQRSENNPSIYWVYYSLLIRANTNTNPLSHSMKSGEITLDLPLVNTPYTLFYRKSLQKQPDASNNECIDELDMINR